ncbi:DUF1064 domain-containing protein [Crenothrix sp.]|uniref:DUF1064 domain-containing protein n=1 Tax=Crenothrix sp. TaxID=3100433 RepID=UPI00374D9E99
MRNLSKYRAVKTVVDGLKFDSKAEAKRYLELKALQQSGVIADLELQKEFELIPKQPGERATKYKADFVYRNSTGLVVEDVKGFLTPEYRIKRKLLLWVHGVRISEVR